MDNSKALADAKMQKGILQCITVDRANCIKFYLQNTFRLYTKLFNIVDFSFESQAILRLVLTI